MGATGADYYGIVAHPTDPRILLLRKEQGWSLPHLECEMQGLAPTGHIIHWMKERFHFEVTVLHCPYYLEGLERDRVHAIFVLENHTSVAEPPKGGRWVKRDALDALPLAVPEHSPVIHRWFTEIEQGDVPTLRAPWGRLGWFVAAVGWMTTHLDHLGYRATGPVEQLRAWPRSCLLRQHTSGGDVYLKAVPPQSAHESPLTQFLAERYPSRVPEVLAIEAHRHWLLMRDFGGQPLFRQMDIALWEDALRQFAGIQIACSGDTDSLVASGCPDRRLSRMGSQIDTLVADVPAMQPGRPDDLTDDQIGELRRLAPKLKAMCAALQEYGVPETLTHGDFCTGNVQLTGHGALFHDWSDSSLSHPFFDLAWFLECGLPGVPDVRERLCRAYLEPWTVFEPMERLQRAFALAQPLGALHLALIYQGSMLPNVEVPWTMEEIVPDRLRKVLQHCKSSHAATGCGAAGIVLS